MNTLRNTVAPTTHSPDEKGTSIYRIRKVNCTRLRTGTDPYPGRIISKSVERISCRLSDERVKEIGVFAAYEEEQERYWRRKRLDRDSEQADSKETCEEIYRRAREEQAETFDMKAEELAERLPEVEASDNINIGRWAFPYDPDADREIAREDALKASLELPPSERKKAVDHAMRQWRKYADKDKERA